MTTSITQTKLSRQTLDAIARVAYIVGKEYPNLEDKLERVMVQIAESGYQDAQIDIATHTFEPEHFPSDLKWSESTGHIGSEVN